MVLGMIGCQCGTQADTPTATEAPNEATGAPVEDVTNEPEAEVTEAPVEPTKEVAPTATPGTDRDPEAGGHCRN